jgi:hypothetical protein
MNEQSNKLQNMDLDKFSDNASRLLLEQDKLQAFFDSINYDLKPHGDGFHCTCPACHQSAAFIGVNGRRHRVYWRCLNSECDSHFFDRKPYLVHNFLGLVKGIVEDRKLGTAMKVISTFLGYEGRSKDLL